MARRPKRNPSFFKVLVRSFTRRLRLPPVFARKYGEVLPENVTLTTESGESWKVKLEEDDGHHYLTKGWGKFAEDLHLKMWTFLVFRLVGNSTVKVSMYGLNGCEMDSEIDADDSESDEELPLRRSAYNAKGKQVVTIKKEAWTTTGEDTPESSSKAMNPQFQVILTNGHRCRMIIYKSFAAETGLDGESHAVLEDPQRRYWQVALVRRKEKSPRLEMMTGWSQFRQANKLAIGDTCSFEFVPSKNVIRVKVIKPASK